MPRPSLPKYNDPENTMFHPVFLCAFNEVLSNLALSDLYEIIPQFQTPTGPVDFAVLDKNTNKVILPVEIKRSISSVRGIGRRQARDYWNNLGAKCQTSFYCVSNLEVTELFRHEQSRKTTLSQRVVLSVTQDKRLGQTTPEVFYEYLISSISEMLLIVTGAQPYSYSIGLGEFQESLISALNNIESWHRVFIPACFEYIRGVGVNDINIKSFSQNWKAASFYAATPQRILELGRTLDFEHIFCPPLPPINDVACFSNSVIPELFASGKALGTGDDIAEAVGELLSPPNRPGIVETDTELAQLLAVFSRDALGRNLQANEAVFDPGSASGKLLAALQLTAFPNITPKQVIANEIERRFSEVLSLRLGLAFSGTISPTNCPNIYIGDINDIEPTKLSNVKVVVMNPPFISGVQSAGIKIKFAERIKALTGTDAQLNSGQIALEALFLELVWQLVPDGTVIATILPTQHLYRLSNEVAAFRRFIAEKMAVTHIVQYPQNDLFAEVMKQTIVIIGIKGCVATNVKMVDVQSSVRDIDFSELLLKLQQNSLTPTSSISISSIARTKLVERANEGWKSIIGIGSKMEDFLNSYFAQCNLLQNCPQLRRGTVGNGGSTKLTVFSKTTPIYKDVVDKIPLSWIKGVLNNTDNIPRILSTQTAPELSFAPPSSAFSAGTSEHTILQDIISKYLSLYTANTGVQARAAPTMQKVLKAIKSDQKVFGSEWVLIPRASRVRGEISFHESGDVLLSTNVIMVKAGTLDETKLLATWLFSIFGQLQLELYSTPQEGMRKLEISSVNKVKYPNLSEVSAAEASNMWQQFQSTSALEFRNIHIREIDKLWAKHINPSNPDKILKEALFLMNALFDERAGYS